MLSSNTSNSFQFTSHSEGILSETYLYVMPLHLKMQLLFIF
jgi:hypothetical protein